MLIRTSLLNNFEKVYQHTSVLEHRRHSVFLLPFGNILLILEKEFVEDNIKRLKKVSFDLNSQLPDSTIFIDEDI